MQRIGLLKQTFGLEKIKIEYSPPLLYWLIDCINSLKLQITWHSQVEEHTNPSIIFHRTPSPSNFPGPPNKPIISDVTQTSVHLAWRSNTNSGASEVFAYTVEYFSHETGEVGAKHELKNTNNKLNHSFITFILLYGFRNNSKLVSMIMLLASQGWVISSDTVREQAYVVRRLKPDTSYLFLIRAQNSYGLSLPSHVAGPVKSKGACIQNEYNCYRIFIILIFVHISRDILLKWTFDMKWFQLEVLFVCFLN